MGQVKYALFQFNQQVEKGKEDLHTQYFHRLRLHSGKLYIKPMSSFFENNQLNVPKLPFLYVFTLSGAIRMTTFAVQIRKNIQKKERIYEKSTDTPFRHLIY